VMTCDSIGAIGPKELDVVLVEPVVVGSFLARVALLELISTGAELTALSCTFSVDPETSEQILEGVYAEARLIHPDPERITIATTEKNVPTRQTGVGITCVGVAQGGSLRVGMARSGDLVVALGTPKVGVEVTLDDPDNANLPKLKELLGIPGVRDIAPAGSKGLLYEASAIANSSGLNLSVETTCEKALHKSAGPATALVLACTPEAYLVLTQHFRPIIRIGTLF